MNITSDSFDDFLIALKAHDDAASRELFQRFAGQLMRLARRHIQGLLKNKVDPEDVVQSAYKSFFLRYDASNLKVVNWNSLWGLLTLITVRKCAERIAYHRAERRDAARELSTGAAIGIESPWVEAISREPTPQEVVELSEAVDHLLAGLKEEERPVIELSLLGHTTQEISEQLHRPERTVRRLRERIRTQLQNAHLAGSTTTHVPLK